ncbi:ABC transporter related [Opitutus terrae PB90-1]|uniref:ABC transporter related n=2 Tax=Opitutus terrae TaxID=107709 RepID=B1ZW86_OPITP|nr:ABC transporter related [Opitutus terrae PB90-1]
MERSPLVEFQEVTKRFGDGPAVLEQISLTAAAGDFIGLIGPSGCGKSTLLRLIAGLSPITHGSLTIGGRSPEAAAADLAFVFQESTLLPWLNVAKNVEAPLRLRRIPGGQRVATRQRVLELVGLGDRGPAYPRQLSGGQKMRVSIARALALAPRLLLLDEPFGALDEMTRERLNEELLAIREQQAWTAFFVTHSVAEAVFLSNRIVVLSSAPGRIAAEVPVDLPYPRTAETRLSRAYHDLVTEVSRVLRQAESPRPVA